MSPARLPEAPWKLNAWHDAQRAASPDTVSDAPALARLAEALAFFGWRFDQVFARNARGYYVRADADGRYGMADKRGRVWSHMLAKRQDSSLSYPQVARVTNCRSHVTVLMAVKKLGGGK